MKKIEQLGMNPSTASNRLVKDLLWNFIVADGLNFCYHCNEGMTRDNFSIEHKEPWLDSKNPLKLYFDLDNIAYSHRSCNSKAGGEGGRKYHTPREVQDSTNKAHRAWWAKKSPQERTEYGRKSRERRKQRKSS